MRGLANRPWWHWLIGFWALASLLVIIRNQLLTDDSASAVQVHEGVLETADFTLPIPAGYRALSPAEVVERSKREGSTKNLVAVLEKADTSGVAVVRNTPRSSEKVTPPVRTREECDRFLTKLATLGKFSIVTEATVVELSPDGLGTSCQYTIATKGRHLTQIVTTEWGIACMHAPGEGASCVDVAAGFRRVKR